MPLELELFFPRDIKFLRYQAAVSLGIPCLQRGHLEVEAVVVAEVPDQHPVAAPLLYNIRRRAPFVELALAKLAL